ncbi:MAG: hypothetical protein FJX80_05960 [Bacteroidetes bacterium]|nr:hypothetical protein [Bacteroidota bacterium]
MAATKKRWYEIWWVWIIIAFFLYSLFSNEAGSSDDDCGCSDQAIVEQARQLGISRERSRQMCCEAQEYIKKNKLDQ